MKKKILVLLVSILAGCNNQMLSQVQFEMDNNLVLKNLDTVTNNSSLYELTRSSDHELNVKQASSIHIEGLQNIPYNSGFENYGASYKNGHFYKHENRVYLGGLIRRTNGGPFLNDDVIFVLPNGYRPEYRLIAKGSQSGSLLRINIEVDGRVRIIGNAPNSLDFLSLDGISFRTPSLYLSQEIAGGYLFHIADPPVDFDGDGIADLGLICAYEDIIGTTWGCPDLLIGDLSSALGAGFANTQIIINECPEEDITARVIDNLVADGFNDWFMPTYQTLEIMWNVLADTDDNGTNTGPSDPGNIAGFSAVFYSGSNNYILGENILVQGVTFGSYSLSSGSKSEINNARPVRILKVSDL